VLVTTVVLQRAQILAIGQTVPGPTPSATATGPPTTGSGGGSSNGSTSLVPVTFALNQVDAEKIMELSDGGLPYLGLLNGSTAIPTSAGSTAHP
jgi:hypothetical protein